MISREQKISGYKALAEAGVDVTKEMAAEGLTAPESPAKAEARARLDVLKTDREWFRRYMSGGADAVEGFQSPYDSNIRGTEPRCLSPALAIIRLGSNQQMDLDQDRLGWLPGHSQQISAAG
jgi:hypothetical protein